MRLSLPGYREVVCQVSAVVKLGIEVTNALAKAHRLGVIHRDFKASNIKLTANGAKLSG